MLRAGLEGIEPYGTQIGAWLDKPVALKQTCNRAGVALIDIGDLPSAWSVTAGSAGFVGSSKPRFEISPRRNPRIDPEGDAELIEHMVSFARDF